MTQPTRTKEQAEASAPDLDAVAAEQDRAMEEARRLEWAHDIERRDRIASFTKQLDDGLGARLGAGIKEARDAARRATRAYEDALIAAGLAKLAAIGDLRREEWGYGGNSWERNRPYKPTGRTGLLEVRDRDSKFPDNMSEYSLPSFGAVFIRINKKDGGPSLQFVTRSYREDDWKPIGWILPESKP